MITYTVQHILVMRLITQYNFANPVFLHTLLYFASAGHLDKHEIGFYDFVRTNRGVHSFQLQEILNELTSEQLVDKTTLKLTEKGHNIYYALARAIQPFEDYWLRCVNTAHRFNNDFTALQSTLKSNLSFRRTKSNQPIFFNQ